MKLSELEKLADTWIEAASVLRDIGLGPVAEGQAVQLEICADHLRATIAIESEAK
jgi:hypothetical protein